MLVCDFRGHGNKKLSSRAISPVPGSRSSTAATSPLHPRLLSPGSGNRQDDGMSQCHPLPLPPSSPTSPLTLPNKRTRVVDENIPHSLSQWKKGKLLGRGSFGHVYVGFNRYCPCFCRLVVSFNYLKSTSRTIKFIYPGWLHLTIFLHNCDSDSGQMCAIKEVKVVQDDRASKECLKQLNQVIFLCSFSNSRRMELVNSNY